MMPLLAGSLLALVILGLRLRRPNQPLVLGSLLAGVLEPNGSLGRTSS